MRVVNGKIQQVEISKLEEVWNGKWKYTNPERNMKGTTAALAATMMAGGLEREEDV